MDAAMRAGVIGRTLLCCEMMGMSLGGGGGGADTGAACCCADTSVDEVGGADAAAAAALAADTAADEDGGPGGENTPLPSALAPLPAARKSRRSGTGTQIDS